MTRRRQPMNPREAALSIIDEAERKLWRCDACGELCEPAFDAPLTYLDNAYGMPYKETVVPVTSDCCGAPVEDGEER
jgi:hypothetical protein